MTEQEAIKQFKERLSIEYYRTKIPEYYATMEMAVSALEEIQQYRALGTVEELRDAREKQIPYKPKVYEDKYYACKCGNVLMMKWRRYNTELMPKSKGLPFCLSCGQAIDWSGEE